MPKRTNEIGINMWDIAPASFRSCPRCGASAKVRHVEPRTGGGPCAHEHRCRRCRHEWATAIEDHETCPYEDCTGPEYLDATTLPILKEILPQYLLDRDQLGLSSDHRPFAQKLEIMRIAAKLRKRFCGDELAISCWLNSTDPELKGRPADVIAQPYGMKTIWRHLSASANMENLEEVVLRAMGP